MLDLKIGTRHYSDDAPPKKIAKEQRKADKKYAKQKKKALKSRRKRARAYAKKATALQGDLAAIDARIRGLTADEDDVEGGCGEEGACDAAQSAEMICACTYTFRPYECLLHGDLRCGAGSDFHQIETLEGG